ncbi:class I SAM-dependent methyltransferase [Aestuariibius sp. 2305UL40-4]|uniref:class I SAM-dependent methyltransferase n=1 Tax=Aestuariibius violaceus TaxID=3234132 RepID=UPI00345E47CD
MRETPELFDQSALKRQRRQAHEMFLQNRAATEVEERLSEINRAFTALAVITPFPSLWQGRLPDARILAPAATLALGESSADLVIHGLALHTADDPVGQLIQVRRALRPDGLFVGTLFGGQTLFELRASLAEAEVALTGGLSQRVSPMADIRDLGALLQRAGFALPVADTDRVTVAYRDLRHLRNDLRAMGEGNALAGRRRTPPPRDLFPLAERIYREKFSTEDGKLAATFEIVTLTGWAPAPEQPRPLRPGSAQARLADALNTIETALPRGEDT